MFVGGNTYVRNTFTRGCVPFVQCLFPFFTQSDYVSQPSLLRQRTVLFPKGVGNKITRSDFCVMRIFHFVLYKIIFLPFLKSSPLVIFKVRCFESFHLSNSIEAHTRLFHAFRFNVSLSFSSCLLRVYTYFAYMYLLRVYSTFFSAVNMKIECSWRVLRSAVLQHTSCRALAPYLNLSRVPIQCFPFPPLSLSISVNSLVCTDGTRLVSQQHYHRDPREKLR